jgi:hypothetical protein
VSRHFKAGLDYMPLDTSMDDKIDLVEAIWQLEGFAILIKLFQKIYSNGYYHTWSEKEQLLFAGRIHKDIDTLKSFIGDCINFDIFDRDLLEKYHVLTSRGIQKRYFAAASRRKKIEICPNLLLVDISDYINDDNKLINVDINSKNGDGGTQKEGRKEGRKERDDDVDINPKNEQFLPLAQLLADLIERNDSRYFKRRDKAKTVLKWANDIRLLVESDGYPTEEVDAVIRWCQKDDFWKANILSAGKLREQFPRLRMQAEKGGSLSRASPRKSSPYVKCPQCGKQAMLTNAGPICSHCGYGR